MACVLPCRETRRLVVCWLPAVVLLVVASLVIPPAFSSVTSPFDLTIVLDYRGPHSDRSEQEMRRETEKLLSPSGLRVDWRYRDQAAHEIFNNLVVVRFDGVCRVDPVPYVYDELGPLAFTYTSDREVLPFSEVACNKVAASVRSAMWGGDFKKADFLMGRALGRVLVHELVHILTQSKGHAHEGVQRPALSGSQLIAERLSLSAADLAMLRETVATRP